MKSTAFVIRVAICFLLSLIPLRELENSIYSARLHFRGKSGEAPNLLILTLGNQDFGGKLEGLRELYLWDAEQFAKIVSMLFARDAAQVLVTWYLPPEVVEPLSPTATATFASFKQKMLWSAAFDPEGKFLPPSRALLTRGTFGFQNLSPDSDGTVRRGSLLRESKPSLTWATRLALLNGNQPDRTPSDPFLINYAGPAGTIRTCSFREAIQGGACGELRGRIVLLAREDDPANNGVITPLGVMSRAEVLANELRTVVNQNPIHTASFFEQALVVLAMIVGGAFYILYYPVLFSAIAVTSTGVVVVIFLFQLLLTSFSVYVPSANVAGSLLITYLVFTGYRLAFQENLQWRSLKQQQYLKELDQMKTNFLSLVSHDLKTPLAKIQAVVERMRKDENAASMGPHFKEQLDSIDNSNNELKHYITSILNLSRIESQKVILNKKSNDINQIIQHVLRRLRSAAQTKQITFEESLEPLFSVECDEGLMTQVLSNLVDNAIRYSPAGQKIIVRSREEEGFIRVDVEDFGPGIPKDQLPLMFRKFSRFLRPMNEQVKGTGLGLYLSKYFIELHGGTIRLKTLEGQGTTFTFTLPLHGDESETLLS